ncbi:MAG: hypothetical protein Q9174_002055 [Haloplaca sp. 1 TL-2023]
MASAASKSSGVVDGEQIQEQEAKSNDEPRSGTTTPQHPASNPRVLRRASTTTSLPSTSAANSPKPSRETSPVRPPLRSGVSANSGNPRSRKNSTDLSPNRGPVLPGPIIPAVPSAAAIQRALSVAGVHQLQPSSSADPNTDPVRSQKSIKQAFHNTNQQGVNLPRVRSPPPMTPTKNSQPTSRRSDLALPNASTPSIIVDQPSKSAKVEHDGSNPTTPTPTSMRVPSRGISGNHPALETVQESSLPDTNTQDAGTEQQGAAKVVNDKRPERIEEEPLEDDLGKDLQSRPESGNDSAGSRDPSKEDVPDTKHQDTSKTSAAKPQVVHPRRSHTQLHPGKGKTGAEGSVKSMTVETETVSSVPQVALGGGTGERGLIGRTDTGVSLRPKPSTETIRPKKEKKRVVRKAPSMNAGTGGFPLFRRFHHHHPFSRPPSPEQMEARPSNLLESVPGLASDTTDTESSLQSPELASPRSLQAGLYSKPLRPEHATRYSLSVLTNVRGRVASSKSDIFEAKVASAVDEADSSDSEETFVYESNPPEPLSARPHRFHSRTPSATSMASQFDQYGVRPKPDGHQTVVGKKSMKFANNSYHSTNHPIEGAETGTVRGPSQNSRGTPSHHRHIGHHGRNGGHTSLFDSNSPFLNATKPPRTQAGNVGRLSSRPSSPRSPNVIKVSGSPRKPGEPLSYDMEGEGADDERTPLIGSVRSNRTRGTRRAAVARGGYPLENEKRRRRCRAVTVYTSLVTVMTALIAAVVILIVMCSKPLLEVRIKDIRNVLASEQELMLDLYVHAINPNLVAVQVSDLDINIFAKSKHVGTGEMWRHRDQMHSSEDNMSLYVEHHLDEQLPPTYHSTDNVDEGTDPYPADPESDSQTMLLGRIFEFDSPLIFDPSPLHHTSLGSIGEVRLAHPGNKTEEGGSARWEKVLQYDFELIVRGVIKYGLPLSSGKRKASVGASVVVSAEKGLSGGERGDNTLLRKPGRRRWSG